MSTYLSDLFSLQGKTALVVGGNGVLGGHMAIALARAGARVAVTCHRNAAGARARVDEIGKLGGEAMIVTADASKKMSLQEAEKEVLGRWGALDIVVNAPGTNSTTTVLEIQEEEWYRILDTNAKGVFLSCQVFGGGMVARKARGTIINISSVSSEIPLSKVLTYSVSKAGVNIITRYLAREWGPQGVRVNAIMPGFFPAEQNRKILTPERRDAIYARTPLGRYGEPATELAGVLLWLASEKASSYVTGAIVPVDGGFTATSI